ncbi:chorismate synthase [Saccharicrinis sp. FJH62]|uniref:chorismate synthase n=1 Tax=Saccharicrinis sp. FJH62 TaxID=3344657 RepID=UPI0035D49182
MAGNTWGKIYRLSSFGESHGLGVGGVIDGCPPGTPVDIEFIQNELSRRRPGQSRITTPRKEEDQVEILSGVLNGIATGTPIGFLIHNKDQRSGDYDNMKSVYRPSHSDYVYETKYGVRDHRGGGRSSARETIARVVAGAIAKQALKAHGIQVTAFTSSVGDLHMEKPYTELDLSTIEDNIIRCPDQKIAEKMIDLVDQVRKEGDTIGGVITGVVQGLPVGLGEPVFDKLHAELGKAMLSINAVKGFEYGSGFAGTQLRGSQHNDPFEIRDGKVRTTKNHSGGIQGGISNGEDVYFRVAFKPVATVLRDQNTVDSEGKETVLKAKGRHDPCVLPRAVPIVESMAAMVMLDMMLINKIYR